MKREFFDSEDTKDTFEYLDSLRGPTINQLQRLEAGEEDFSAVAPLLADMEVDQGPIARPNTIYCDLTRVAMNPGGKAWFIPGRG